MFEINNNSLIVAVIIKLDEAFEFAMFLISRWILIGSQLVLLLGAVHSFVLLTANVDDLKRIAQKFVSESLADKIAQFIVEASENNINLSSINESNKNVKTNKKDVRMKQNTKKDITQEKEIKTYNIKRESKIKDVINTDKFKNEEYARKVKKSPSNVKSKKKESRMRNEDTSLQYFRESMNRLDKINLNTIVDLDKIILSDESNDKISRKEFNRAQLEEKPSAEDVLVDTDTERPDNLTDNQETPDPPVKKSYSDEATSDDFSYNNKLESKSDEVATMTNQTNNTPFSGNLTTEKERNEFDQYLNTNYPKAKVVATSGALELRKQSDILELTDTEYD